MTAALAAVPPQPRLAEDALRATLAGFTALMQSALAGDARDRFKIVASLAAQADKLFMFASTSPRVSDFDKQPMDIDLLGDNYGNGGIAQGMVLGGPIRHLGGDQMELYRGLIDAVVNAATNLQSQPRRLPPIEELNGLLSMKQMLTTLGDPTADVDARIEILKQEVFHADRVVSTELLRGHQTEAGRGHEDARVVGEADAR